MTPLVSVLIPCHNAAPWLAATLTSVRAQSHSRCEIVLIDDGSTDSSREIAAAHAGPDLTFVAQPNTGAAAARQRALDLARGDFIQYLDADDLLHPEKIARQVARLAAVGDRNVASSRWVRFTEETNVSAAFTAAPEPNWHDATSADYLVETFATGGMMHPAAWLVPRAVAARAGPWNTALSLDDDGEYFTRVVLAAEGVRFCGDALVHYRSQVAGSLSGRRSPAAWSSAHEVCRLSTTALLAREGSTRARRACALYWLRFAFAGYPEAGPLVTNAVARARALDPAATMPSMGPRFEKIAALLGWRAAKRLRALIDSRPSP
jgi:glycosyltransferase involved in cell wall biosynthesis